jgi:hypothetical protein
MRVQKITTSIGLAVLMTASIAFAQETPADTPPVTGVPAPPAVEAPTAPAPPSMPDMPKVETPAPPAPTAAPAAPVIAPLALTPPPAAQAEYPPCTKTLQDQCANSRDARTMPRKRVKRR